MITANKDTHHNLGTKGIRTYSVVLQYNLHNGSPCLRPPWPGYALNVLKSMFLNIFDLFSPSALMTLLGLWDGLQKSMTQDWVVRACFLYVEKDMKVERYLIINIPSCRVFRTPSDSMAIRLWGKVMCNSIYGQILPVVLAAAWSKQESLMCC